MFWHCCNLVKAKNGVGPANMNQKGTCGRTSGWVLFFFVSLICSFHRIVLAQPDLSQASCAPPSDNTYDWENYNYYQILDLSPPPQGNGQLKSRKQRRKERSKIHSSDIRKAYRKQAQLFHPDKLKSKKQAGSNETLSKEETTARFARIAEAYEVLNDDTKRVDYDDFLLDCEDRLAKLAASQEQGEGSDGRWSFFDDLSTDPWSVFEDFFFGSAQPGEAAGIKWEDEAHNAGRRGKFPSPRRVFEREEFRYDRYHGVEIMRILQTEEYDVDPSSGRYFYRVFGQDFVEQHDPFHGWEYHPITQPFLVEEGYRFDRDFSNYDTSSFSPKPRQFPDKLLPGESLFPNSEALLTSLNGRYYAGISKECELVIMSDSSRMRPQVEDKVVWSSETFVPAPHLRTAGGCFLTLRGPRLVLALGTPDDPGSLLWFSEVSHSQETAMEQGMVPLTFFARLDDDGSLAVYSQSVVDLESVEANSPHFSRLSSWWSSINKKMETYPWWTRLTEQAKVVPQTRAARAWMSLRKWVGRRILGKKSSSSTQQPSSDEEGSATIERCIYATGLAGCNSPARKFLHVASDMTQSVKHRVKHTVTRIDRAMDDFAEYLQEEVDEDDDVLDALFRVLGAAGRGIGKTGHKIARRSVKAVRNTVQKMRS